MVLDTSRPASDLIEQKAWRYATTLRMNSNQMEMTARGKKRTPEESYELPTASSNWAEAASGEGAPFAAGPAESGSMKSLAELSPVDKKNFFVLCLLYLLQGIPVGLAFGSIPFLLKSKLSYGQVGIFTMASYPYSLKLFWSPIVDGFYSRSFGRRKTWIVPIQTVSGIVLLLLSSVVQPLLDDAESNLPTITLYFFSLVFLCATQDIAVDGWALTLLSHPALSFASTAQTIGLNTGYFTSFTVFLALSSPEFANKYFRTVPGPDGLVTLSGYLKFWGVTYLITTLLVGIFKSEGRHKSDEKGGIISVYRSMYKMLRLPAVQQLIIVHAIAKIGFQANEAVTNLKLLEKGLSKEDLALTVMIDFPFEIIFGYYAAKWSTGSNPLRPWNMAFMGRIAVAAVAVFTVAFFPKGGAGFFYLLWIIVVHCLGSFMSTVQFVGINAFHTQIADPLIGGTYMTTLNTISNLGGQWPRILVLAGVDWFTQAECQGPNILQPFSCATEHTKTECKNQGGTCHTSVDGYYITSFLCIALGLTFFFTYIQRRMQYLEKLPTAVWRLH